MTAPNAGIVKAIELIDHYTAGRCDYGILVGPHNVKARQAIMGALLGRTASQSEAGITVLRERLYKHAGATEGCIARRDDALRGWLLANLAIMRSHDAGHNARLEREAWPEGLE